MRTRKKLATFLSTVFGAALLLGAGTTAHALSITFSDATGCGGSNCFGSVYTLSLQSSVAGATTTQYDFLYSVNTAGYTGGGSGLDAVAFKVATEANIVSATLLSQVNTGNTFGAAVIGGLDAGGCAGGSSGGFICSQSSNLGGVGVPNGTYSFTFRTVLNNGSLFGDPNQWSLKALYVDGEGKQAGITSAQGSVPEPATSLLFGVGLALIGGWQRSRSQRVNEI